MSRSVPSYKQAMRRISQLPSQRSLSLQPKSRTRCISSLTSTPKTVNCQSALLRRPLSPQCLQYRTFSSTSRRSLPSGADKVKHRTGPFSFRSAALFVGTGLAMVFYFQYEKARLERKRVVEMSKGYGKPKVGGPFTLKDLDGKEFTEKDLLGKYSLIYFGFSHCPDICPDELDKMSAAIDIVQEKAPNSLQSIFISCDPARDTPEVLREYLAEFHPSIQGLTGTWHQTKDVCKQYRVYFSTPPELKPGEEDYLVDHSIYFYVMDPEGDFVECIGRQDTPESAAGIVLQHVKDWRKEKKPIDTTPITWNNVKKEKPRAPPNRTSATISTPAPA